MATKPFAVERASAAEPKDRSRISTLDFLLMMVGSMLAVYSAGESVGQPEVGWYFVRLVGFGSVLSFLIRQVGSKSKWIKIDGFLYAGVAIFATFNVARLNQMLPGEPFPRELQAAAYLSWMLTLGSFVSWRDGTLLFQAVPAMALFGLVGCYDTYRDVTFAFFGFLLCLATLFARANGRDMLRLVIDSGYAGRADARNADRQEIRQDQALYERVRQGPWRWIAGPEWALLTAFVVILLSLLGAPVIQTTVQAATGGLKINLTQPPVRRTATPTAEQDLQMVGRGPNTNLSTRELYTIKTDRPVNYFRLQTFDKWSGLGWRKGGGSPGVRSSDYIDNPQRVVFTIKRLVPVTNIPVPGEVLGWNNPAGIDAQADGSYRSLFYSAGGDSGTSVIAPATAKGTTAVNSPDYEWARDLGKIHNDVAELAAEATRGATTDLEMAEQIRAFIAARAKYNLKAAATPAGDDPVQFFLMTSKEGYCDVFASSMVQMARYAGLPARYVQGYLTDSDSTVEDDGAVVIREKDYHAWCEVLLDGTGWTIFDATAGATAVEGGERGKDVNSDPWAPGGLLRRLLDAAIVAVAVFVVGSFGYLQWQNRTRVTRRSEVDRLYGDFQRSLTKLGSRRRQPSRTISEFISESVPEPLREQAIAMGRRFESAFYQDGEPDVATVAALKADLSAWQQAVKGYRPPAKSAPGG